MTIKQLNADAELIMPAAILVEKSKNGRRPSKPETLDDVLNKLRALDMYNSVIWKHL